MKSYYYSRLIPLGYYQPPFKCYVPIPLTDPQKANRAFNFALLVKIVFLEYLYFNNGLDWAPVFFGNTNPAIGAFVRVYMHWLKD